MSDNNNGQVTLYKLDPNDPWALNLVNAQYDSKIVSMINKSMEQLMMQLAKNVSLGANALYSVAGAIYLGSICKAATDLGGAAGGLYAGHESSAVEKDAATEMKGLDKESKDISDQLSKVTKQEDKNKLISRQDEIKSKKEKIQNKLATAQTKANMKMGVYKGAADGLGAIPQGMQEAQQQKGQADKSIFDSVSHQAGTAYDSCKSMLRPFLDIDYFAGLVTLGNITFK